MATVTIRVRDRAKNAQVRRVRVHRSDTGAVLAEGVSNAFSGNCTLTIVGFFGDAYAVVLDDIAGVREPHRIVRLMI